jgi:ABC-type antimicrobial peptide transport system permease subunit
VSQRYITPQFFSAMGIPFLRGRDFDEGDAAGNRRIAIVSESFAQRYWPGGDALDKAFLFNDTIMTVVGVVGDIKVRGLERESEPQLYMPTSLAPESPMTFYDPKDLVIRANGSTKSLIPAIRGIIRGVDPDQPVSDVQTLSELMDQQTAARAAQVRALLVLACVAVLLAGFGIYGLLAFMVAQQRQEIAVRLALGAEPGRIARGVMWNGMSIVLIGLIPGLFVAFAAGQSMSSLLFGVQPRDPIIVVATVVLCVFVSITGALLPALRSVRVSPMSVMRSE